MPVTDQQPVTPAPIARRQWPRWILIWLFGAAVGALLVFWLAPKTAAPTGTSQVKTPASVTPSPSSSPVTKTRIAADATSPAAGTCLAATGSNATITLGPDIPSPRCVQLTAAQTWSYINQTGQTVTVYDGDAAVTIPSGQTGSFDFGKFSFGIGVHDEKVFIGTTAFYGGSGPEVWVK